MTKTIKISKETHEGLMDGILGKDGEITCTVKIVIDKGRFTKDYMDRVGDGIAYHISDKLSDMVLSRLIYKIQQENEKSLKSRLLKFVKDFLKQL